mmetsp:Transcript_59451/g.141797  ORF Transcript_59451/g.141797 Transcript_59451/m.141797 type:complete len:232 (+) Transcript_59451:75-770(+)|eukprot:CAMPEP_0181437258 /NCGR_PEP_ID=MMETSP1110-20121109/21283_1 /TAXON_ID=174948 /ORGANISM="Symbiodinium sp., Strain CCMP421" /LENGTH=231 /DNA_ID=CAMNT_0023560873 /DNA_START=63 /DNA_END=758 /DNA_ORIENTATION=-
MLCCCSVSEEPNKLESVPVNAGKDTTDVFEEQKLSSLPAPAEPASETKTEDGPFTVELDKGSGSFGLSLDYEVKDRVTPDVKDRCLVLSVNGGAVAEWNTKNPDKLLQVGDCIMAVNGTTGSSESLFEAVKKADKVTLTVQHPKELKVPVGQGGRLMGMDIDYADTSVGLIVKQVKAGPVKDWSASSGAAVQAGDRITQVNNRGQGNADLLQQLKTADGELTLTILSWPSV